MEKEPAIILLTGHSGVGKTTIIRKVVGLLDKDAGGFYTRELREHGRRVGFEVVTLTGETAVLAAKSGRGTFAREAPFKGYQVNLDAIETVAVPSLERAMTGGQIVVVDEIGPMELLSSTFRETILALLEGTAVAVGTIVRRAHPFADKVKAHPRVVTRVVTPQNRDALPGEIEAILSRSCR